MTHEEASTLFEPYFAGLLSREQTRAFHAHLGDCEDCKVHLRALNSATRSPFRSRLAGGGQDADLALKAQLYRNRVMTYAVVAVLVAFFLLFKLKAGLLF